MNALRQNDMRTVLGAILLFHAIDIDGSIQLLIEPLRVHVPPPSVYTFGPLKFFPGCQPFIIETCIISAYEYFS